MSSPAGEYGFVVQESDLSASPLGIFAFQVGFLQLASGSTSLELLLIPLFVPPVNIRGWYHVS